MDEIIDFLENIDEYNINDYNSFINKLQEISNENNIEVKIKDFTNNGGSIIIVFDNNYFCVLSDENDYDYLDLLNLNENFHDLDFEEITGEFYENILTNNFWKTLEIPTYGDTVDYVYHGTGKVLVDDILEEGLEGSYGSGLYNRGQYGIFTDIDINFVNDSYGSTKDRSGKYEEGYAVFKIDVLKMKNDGFTPEIQLEQELMDNYSKKYLIDLLGIDYDYDYSYASDGNPTTIIFSTENIPPKYIEIEEMGEKEIKRGVIITEQQYKLLFEAKELKTTHPLYAKLFNKFRSDLLEDKELAEKAKQITTVDINQKNIDKLNLTPSNLMEIISNDDIIKGYIEKYNELAKNNIEIKNFDCDGKKLTFKDFNDITFKCFEQNVDSKYSQYKSKQEFKGNTNIREYKDLKNEFVYSDENLDVYKSTTKNNCIQYVELLANENKRNYSFCISDKKNNLFYMYRYGSNESAIFFVYDKSIPQNNPQHLLVIGVRPQSDGSMKYMTTEADNNHSTELHNITKEELIGSYPKLEKVIDKLVAEPITDDELELLKAIRTGVLDEPENFKQLTEEQKEIYIDNRGVTIREVIFRILTPEFKHKAIYNDEDQYLTDVNLHYLTLLDNKNKEDFYTILNEYDVRSFVFQNKPDNFKLKFPEWAVINKLTSIGKLHALFLYDIKDQFNLSVVTQLHDEVLSSDYVTSDLDEIIFFNSMLYIKDINRYINLYLDYDDDIDIDLFIKYSDELTEESVDRLYRQFIRDNKIKSDILTLVNKNKTFFDLFLIYLQSDKMLYFESNTTFKYFILNDYYTIKEILDFCLKHNIIVDGGRRKFFNKPYFFSYINLYELTEDQQKYVIDKNIENVRFIKNINQEVIIYFLQKVNKDLFLKYKEKYIMIIKNILDNLETYYYGSHISNTLLYLTNISDEEVEKHIIGTLYELYEKVKDNKLFENKKIMKNIIITESQFEKYQEFLDEGLKKWFDEKWVLNSSSKLCNVCETKNDKLTLKDRCWTCKGCGTEHDRDLNASINIRNEGKRLYLSNYTDPLSGINACGDQPLGGQ